MWLVLRLQSWEDMELIPNVRLPFPARLSGEPPVAHSPGFLPVFDNEAAALDWVDGDRALVYEIAFKQAAGEAERD